MGPITLYLDDVLEQQMNQLIEQQKQPAHLWLADAIQQKLNNGWSSDVMQLAGSWDDFPSVETLRENSEQNIEREAL